MFWILCACISLFPSYITQFSQPDSIVPNLYNPQSLNRYSYALNNPIRYNDPSGHVVCEVGEPCGPGATYVPETSYAQMTINLKKSAKKRYGVTLSDEGGKNWDAANAYVAYSSLYTMDNALDGTLKSSINGTTFKLAEYHRTKKNCPSGNCTYSGWTEGTTVTFYTTGTNVLRPMNVFHETGHVLNSLPGSGNEFSNRLQSLDHPSFITDGYINSAGALVPWASEPKQASSDKITEQWADVFANYVAGNIDLSKSAGQDMYSFISATLALDVDGPRR